MRLDICLLGPLEIRRCGLPVAIPPGKLRGLLTTLAVRVGRPAPIEEIITRLWDEHPPPSAQVTVRGDVRRLRRLLDPDPSDSLIRWTGGGYQLRISPADLDICRFDEIAAQARVSDDLDARYELLEQALALWRGPALSDVPCASLRRELTPQLEERRVTVLHERIALDLARRRPLRVLAELRGLVAEHPLHEAFWEQLIRALCLAGRRAEALAAYSTCRTTLATHLGVDPGPPLRVLYHRILTGDAPSALGPRGVDPEEHRNLVAPSPVSQKPDRRPPKTQLPDAS